MDLEKLTISIDTRRRLLEDAEMVSLVGSKIFPSVAPTNTPCPFIVYERDAYLVDSTKMGAYKEAATVVYEIISDDYDTGLEIVKAMHRILQGKHNGLDYDIVDSAERFIDGKYRQLIEFKIT